MQEKLYTVNELSEANWFPYRTRTIYKLIKAGDLKSLRSKTCSDKNSNYTFLRIKETAVQDFLQKFEQH